MKKVVSIIIIILTISIITYIIDYNKVKNGNLPVFTFKIENKDKINYYGLGYKVERFIINHNSRTLYEDNNVKIGSWFYTFDVELKPKKTKYDFSIETNIENTCNDMKFVYYITKEGNRIFTMCLSKINVKFKDKRLPLDKALEKEKITLEEITSKMILKENKVDDTKIFIDNKELSNQGLKIFECTNKNYYIVPTNFEYKQEYCK